MKRVKLKNDFPHGAHHFWGVRCWKMGFRSTELFTTSASFKPRVTPARKDLIESGHGVRITWIGHSSFLVQLGAFNVLIDPVYSEYCSPVPLPSLRRVQSPGVAWEALPEIHAVLITHNHYDHLDVSVVRKLARSAAFIVPEGLSPWMKAHGVKEVVDLSWWSHVSLGNGEITCTACPAQHASARTPFDKNKSHWCGWMLEWRGKKIYHAGDTAYCPHFEQIGERFGAVDVSLLPIGAFAPRWLMKPVHTTPEEAVRIHLDIKSRLSIACHWGTFRMTAEPLGEPLYLLEKAKIDHGLDKDVFRDLPIGGAVVVETT